MSIFTLYRGTSEGECGDVPILQAVELLGSLVAPELLELQRLGADAPVSTRRG